jgi:hypothetical protein
MDNKKDKADFIVYIAESEPKIDDEEYITFVEIVKSYKVPISTFRYLPLSLLQGEGGPNQPLPPLVRSVSSAPF